MPVLTESLVRASEVMDAGYTLLQLIEAKEITSEGVVSDMLIFEGVQGPQSGDSNVGRRLTVNFNGKALNPSNPVPDVVKNMLELIAAFLKVSIAEVKQMRGEIKFTAFVGKQVWGEVYDNTYQGKLYKNVKTWAPNDVVPY
jgi:hypothetical protein